MDYQTWVQHHSVGDALMDSYHHIFFEALEQTWHAQAPDSTGAVQERMAFLMMYVHMHFESEEALMASVGYPELEAHQGLHQAFRDRLQQLHERMGDTPDASQALESLHALRDWWMAHIQGEDLRYAPYVRAARATPEP